MPTEHPSSPPNQSGFFDLPRGRPVDSDAALTADGPNGWALDAHFDLGALGRCAVKTSVRLTVASDPEGHFAGGGFEAHGVAFALPPFALAADDAVPEDRDFAIAAQVQQAVTSYLGDHRNWLAWIGAGLIQGVDGAARVGQVLSQTFNLTYERIGQSTLDVFDYSAAQVADCLLGAGADLDEADEVLRRLNFDADAALAPHLGESVAAQNRIHTDVPSVHDDAVTVPHTDSAIPHSDGTTVPHTDNTVTPHADTKIDGIHTDIPKIHEDTPSIHDDIPSVHEDTPKVHTDTIVVPHGDTKT